MNERKAERRNSENTLRLSSYPDPRQKDRRQTLQHYEEQAQIAQWKADAEKFVELKSLWRDHGGAALKPGYLADVAKATAIGFYAGGLDVEVKAIDIMEGVIGEVVTHIAGLVGENYGWINHYKPNEEYADYLGDYLLGLLKEGNQ